MAVSGKILNSFTRAEYILLGGATLFSGAVAYLILSDYSMIDSSFKAKGLPIAAVEDPTNIVKRRPAGVPVWNKVVAAEELFQYDQIYTDANSKVKIRFKSDDEIEITENALVVIEKYDDMASINVKRGVVLASVRSDSPQFRITAGKSSTIFKQAGTNAIIEANGEDAKVSVTSGEAELQTPERTIQINQDREVEVKNDQASIEEPKIQLNLPKLGVDNQDTGELRKVSWTGNADAKSYLLEVARDPGFKDVVLRKETAETSGELPENLEGSYFVRAGSLSDAGIQYSVRKRLSIVPVLPPELKWPPQGKTFEQSDGSFTTFLSWTEDSTKYRYEVQLGTGRDFAQPMLSETVDSSPIRTPDLSVGDYFYRVRAIGERGKRSGWSRVRNFAVGEETQSYSDIPVAEESVVGAEVLEMELGEAVPDYAAGDSAMRLNWRTIGSATGYLVEVSRTPNFSNPEFSQQVGPSTSQLSFAPQSAGKFYWRVRPLGVDGGELIEPKVGYIRPTAKLAGPPNGETLKGGEVSFAWDQKLGAESYTIEVSRTRNFKTIDRQVTVYDTKTTMALAESGEYFWRIKSNYPDSAPGLPDRYSETGDFFLTEAEGAAVAGVGPETDTPEAEVEPASTKPTILSKRFIPKISGPNTESIVIGNADGSAGNVNLNWRGIRSVDEYELQVSGDKAFTEIYDSISSSKPRAGVNLRPGRYYWRVRAKKDGVTSKWSSAEGFRVRRPLPAPRIVDDKVRDKSLPIDKPKVGIAWKPLSRAKKYEIEIAKDSNFTKPVLKKESASLAYAGTIPAGDYYTRVRGVESTGTKGRWSKPVRVAVVEPRLLLKPAVETPERNSEFTFRKNLPRVNFSWNIQEFAKGYDIQVARDQNFTELALNSSIKDTKTSFPLRKGQYYWRVRAKRPKETGQWTASRTFSVDKNTTRPGLTFPQKDMEVNFDETERRSLDVTWDKTNDLDNLVILVARDPGFANPVGRLPVKGNSAKILLKEDGKYYWQLRGRDKRERVAVRSNYSTFEVTTTAVDKPQYIHDSFRVEAAYTPSRMNYSHSEEGDEVAFGVNFKNAYKFSLTGWFNDHWGYEMEFGRRWAEAEFGVDSESVQAQLAFFDITETGGAFRYRWRVLQNSFPIDLGLRFGYHYQPIFTFFAIDEEDDTGDTVSRTYGLVTSDGHNVVLGAETMVPLGGSYNLETKLDYLHLLTTDPISVTKQLHYFANSSLVAQFFQYVSMSIGAFYRYQAYTYEDPANGAFGDLEATYIGFMYAVGYIF